MGTPVDPWGRFVSSLPGAREKLFLLFLPRLAQLCRDGGQPLLTLWQEAAQPRVLLMMSFFLLGAGDGFANNIGWLMKTVSSDDGFP